MRLLLPFVIVPLIEIALFVQIGGAIGLGWTLAIVIVTALIGTYMVRRQGALAMSQIRRSLDELRDPSEPLAHGAMILVSGVLLLTPGFFTDALGFALLLPPVRRAAFRYVRSHVTVERFGQPGAGTRPPPPHSAPGRAPPPRGDVIEGDYDEVDITPPDPGRKPSGWTRH